MIPVRRGRTLIALGSLALLLAGLGIWHFRDRHTPERLPLKAWLERPQREGAIVTDGPVDIKGMTEAVFRPRLPAGLVAPPVPDGRYLLAAFRAPEGHRLLLAPEARVASLPHLPLAGVTVTTASIGLPAAALDELARALPGVDTRFVTGLSWAWADAPRD